MYISKIKALQNPAARNWLNLFSPAFPKFICCSRLNGGLPPQEIHPHGILGMWMFPYLQKKKKVFTIVTELRIPRWDHPEFSKWALNPMMCPYKGKVEGHLRQKRGQIWKRDDKKIEDKKKKDWGRVWSHVVLSQGSLGLPTAARNWRLGRIFPRASSARVAPLTAWFQTSGLQNCEGTNFCCFSPRSSW